jgi:hypothetical protein
VRSPAGEAVFRERAASPCTAHPCHRSRMLRCGKHASMFSDESPAIAKEFRSLAANSHEALAMARIVV